jgi:Uma2 family endonuclease
MTDADEETLFVGTYESPPRDGVTGETVGDEAEGKLEWCWCRDSPWFLVQPSQEPDAIVGTRQLSSKGECLLSSTFPF